MMKIASCIFNVFIDDNNRYNLEEMQLILCGWESYISFQSFKNYEKLLPQSPTPSNHKKHKKKKKHKSNKVGVDKHKYNNNNNNELDRIVPVDIATATPGNAHAPVAHFGGIIQSVWSNVIKPTISNDNNSSQPITPITRPITPSNEFETTNTVELLDNEALAENVRAIVQSEDKDNKNDHDILLTPKKHKKHNKQNTNAINVTSFYEDNNEPLHQFINHSTTVKDKRYTKCTQSKSVILYIYVYMYIHIYIHVYTYI